MESEESGEIIMMGTIPFNSDNQFIVSIENPIDKGYTDSRIEEILTTKLKEGVYAYWNLYTTKSDTTATDIYVYCSGLGKSINKIKSCFPDTTINKAERNIVDNLYTINNPMSYSGEKLYKEIHNLKEYGTCADLFNEARNKEVVIIPFTQFEKHSPGIVTLEQAKQADTLRPKRKY
jgi:hypothetical protein